MKQRVLVIIKPDGMQKNIAGLILNQFLDDGLKLVGLKVVAPTRTRANEHYRHLKEQFFFKQIVSYLIGELHQGSPVVAMVFEGDQAIPRCRRIAGATNPEEANPRSIRGKFGRVTTKGVYENLVHVSSDPKEAGREISLWFKKNELLKV